MSPDGTALAVADSGFENIRSIQIETGIVTTLAGPQHLYESGLQDGTGDAARFDGLKSLVWSHDGSSLYVADGINDCIRKVLVTTTPATVTTFAGLNARAECTEAGRAPRNSTEPWASYYSPAAQALSYHRMDTNEWTLTRPAGFDQPPRSRPRSDTIATTASYSDGVRTCAHFDGPDGLAMSADGTYLVVVDSANNVVRRVGLAIEDDSVTTIAGFRNGEDGLRTRSYVNAGDGVGSACLATCHRSSRAPTVLNLRPDAFASRVPLAQRWLLSRSRDV